MNRYLSLIKFSHTIFALPFAMVGFFLGINSDNGTFSWQSLILVIGCMIFARSAAMAFNRYLDRDIDLKNPRTAVREIPAGVINPKAALNFVILSSVLFVICTYLINPICFYLSPVALAITLGYSFMKRISSLCHFILGLGLALAPIGAYLAVTGEFNLIPVLYSGAVLFWVSGFDIIYALQDEDFDRENDLFSIPVFLGKKNALRLSEFCHLICAGLMIWAGIEITAIYPQVGIIHWAAVGIFVSLLIYQHILVKPNDLSRVNLAFFTTNGVASVIFGTLMILDFYI